MGPENGVEAYPPRDPDIEARRILYGHLPTEEQVERTLMLGKQLVELGNERSEFQRLLNETDQIISVTVKQLRADEVTWAEIGRLLDMDGTLARHRYRPDKTDPKKRGRPRKDV